MKIGVVGGRNFDNYDYFKKCMDQLISTINEEISFVSGGAKGADSMAEYYAKEIGVVCDVYKPDYSKFGRAAPMVRNGDIVNNSDMIVAFWDGISGGTKNSIDRARKQNKQVIIYRFARSTYSEILEKEIETLETEINKLIGDLYKLQKTKMDLSKLLEKHYEECKAKHTGDN
jgi:predicted Rossmann fold nucleotide-binding protein DprA/Smf involved in DNA uptake